MDFTVFSYITIYQGWEFAYQFFERIARFFVSERATSSWKRANCSRCSFAMSDGSDSLLGIKGKGSKKLQKIVFFKQTALKNERFIRKSHKRIIHVAFFYRVTRTIRWRSLFLKRANCSQSVFNMSDFERKSEERNSERAKSQPSSSRQHWNGLPS